MSLINDALKRARDSQQKNPSPSGVTPLLPVEPRERGFNWILATLVIFLMVVACFFISLALAKRTVENTTAAPVAAAPVAAATNSAAPETPAPPQVETGPVAPAIVTLPPAPANTDAVVSVVVAPIKVQGIMYDPSQPSAIVDGKTVHIGDRVFDFHVKTISPNSVTLTGPGGTNEVLRLGE